ncbi:MAG TPA: hypothetical protein VNE67_17275 [Acetobacteraceae bacterium]|nr:hypothetical protein [Stellaceae bacterium]HVB69603.1 hypothetical protein [Acetobacteraceae bacterium]
MSARALGWAWQQHPAQRGGTAKLVLVAIATAADGDGVAAELRQVDIGRMCRLEWRSVRRPLAVLRAEGLVVRYGAGMRLEMPERPEERVRRPGYAADPAQMPMFPLAAGGAP